MENRLLSTAIVTFVALLASSEAKADSLSCDGKIASSGDSTYEVRVACGEPDDAVRHVEYRTVRVRVPAPCRVEHGCRRCDVEVERTVELQVDDWTYDFGSNRFIEFLRFEDGRLVSVREGSYGHKDPR
jgi:hypothetical protein